MGFVRLCEAVFRGFSRSFVESYVEVVKFEVFLEPRLKPTQFAAQWTLRFSGDCRH